MEDAQKYFTYGYKFDYYMSFYSEEYEGKDIEEFEVFINAKSFEDAVKKAVSTIKKHEVREMKLKRNKGFKIECFMLGVYNLEKSRIVEENIL